MIAFAGFHKRQNRLTDSDCGVLRVRFTTQSMKILFTLSVIERKVNSTRITPQTITVAKIGTS